MKALILTLLLLPLTAPSQSVADIYKWVDENGKTHYSDKMPESGKANLVETRVNTIEGISQDEIDSKKVVMYATSWCGYCRKARNYFKKNAIPFTEYDIEKDSAAKRRYDAFNGSGIPVIFIGKKRINGFSQEKFESAYLSNQQAGKK